MAPVAAQAAENTQSYSEAASSVIAWGTQFLVDDGSVRSVVCV